jgi:hypothetical protein
MGEHRNVLPSSTLEMPCQAFQEQGVGSSNGTPVRIPPAEPKKRKNRKVLLPALSFWRRGRDSNPRWNFRPTNDLANRPLQPLGYLSSDVWLVVQFIVQRVAYLRGICS